MHEEGSIQGVLFDVGGTLIECRPAPPEIYARVLSRWGPAVQGYEVAPLFRQTWEELTQEHPVGLDRYHQLKGGEQAWWGEFLRRVLAGLRHPAPQEPVLAELFDAFNEPSLWHVFPEVREVLAGLREQGLPLA
ncbi:MAG: HAD family hydrolase, partial [Acidobacteriota bacterium]